MKEQGPGGTLTTSVVIILWHWRLSLILLLVLILWALSGVATLPAKERLDKRDHGELAPSLAEQSFLGERSGWVGGTKDGVEPG